MSKIDKLIEFKPKTKAVSSDINSNFEQLRVSNNEQEEAINNLFQQFEDYKKNPVQTIECNSDTLEINSETNNFKIAGTSVIRSMTGKTSGFVFLEFLDARKLVNSTNLRLQNNTDRVTRKGDIGIYLFEEDAVKEVNYFTHREESTNAYPVQTILDAPRDKNGKADFIQKIQLTDNIIPVMDSFENDLCAVSSSSQYDSVNYMAWKAFRHHNNDSYGWLTADGITTGWLKIEFKNTSPKVKAFSITSRNYSDANLYSPCDFVFEGSNNDVDWTLLGDYKDNLNWLQNEKRYFALTYFENFKYYRITISKISGAGTYVAIGAFELYESINDVMPMTAKLDFSIDNPLLVNTGIGKSGIGKTNILSQINESLNIENLFNKCFFCITSRKGFLNVFGIKRWNLYNNRHKTFRRFRSA